MDFLLTVAFSPIALMHHFSPLNRFVMFLYNSSISSAVQPALLDFMATFRVQLKYLIKSIGFTFRS